VKVGTVLKRLNAEGWKQVRQDGSHRQFTHPDKPGRRVTLAGRPSKELPTGTLKSIYRQAGWEEDT
jgi:predicted RNA binding protein YcfA (HicA-like mRNA interferase family)